MYSDCNAFAFVHLKLWLIDWKFAAQNPLHHKTTQSKKLKIDFESYTKLSV